MDKPKILDQVRDAIRVKHYSMRTEEAYVYWVKCFILFHKKRHPLQMEEPEEGYRFFLQSNYGQRREGW
ncbi:MAG: phage integrase N-terminal SAM-like domain-containing protein [Candidatus Scalinduaceae bacterium]